MTATTDDEITQEIHHFWQQPPGTPKGWRWTRIGKPGLKYHARRRARRYRWLYTALTETAAVLIFLVATVSAGIFYYPLLADWLGDWAILTCAVCAVTYGIITIASVKILKDW